MKEIIYSKEYLERLYNECGSIGKVAAKLSRPYSTVRYWYHKYNIKVQQSCMTVYEDIRSTPMSSLQKSVILGSVLGDGHLKLAPHSKNSRLRIGHCKKQLGYLKWKHDILMPFSRPVKLDQPGKAKIINGRNCTSEDFYMFYTIAHPDLNYYYNTYYRNNVKVISKDVIEALDIVAIAIWFGDDGSSYIDKRTGAITCSLATNGFTYDEQVILVRALQNFFDGTIKIDKQGNLGRSDFLIRMFNTASNKRFLSALKSILPETIHYKIALRD